MKKKEPVGFISLQIPAGQANPSPPVGPALGQRGLNIMEFCKQFNELCNKDKIEPGMIIPVVIAYYADKSFTITMKKSPVSILVKKALGLKSGSKTPGTQTAGQITIAQIEEIANIKMADMGVDNIEAAKLMVMGTCQSMGIKVQG